MIRVSWEVAGIQAGATHSGMPPGATKEAGPGGIRVPPPGTSPY